MDYGITDEQLEELESNGYMVLLGDTTIEYNDTFVFPLKEAESLLDKCLQALTESFHGSDKKLAKQALIASINCRLVPFRMM